MYQTVHGQLSIAQRLTVASYGFCTVLLMCWMRRHIPHEERPTQRHSQRSGTARWFTDDEGMRKYLVTMLVHAMPMVNVQIRANVFGTIPLERFFSCWRRISHLVYHFTNMMVHFTLHSAYDVVVHFPGAESGFDGGYQAPEARAM
jgi:hypothetical protein